MIPLRLYLMALVAQISWALAVSTDELLSILNKEREKKGLDKLCLHQAGTQQAQMYADKLGAAGTISNRLNGQDGQARYGSLGDPFDGENIFDSEEKPGEGPAQAFSRGLSQHTTQENFANPAVTHVGIGFSSYNDKAGAKRYVWVQAFFVGKKCNPDPEPQPPVPNMKPDVKSETMPANPPQPPQAPVAPPPAAPMAPVVPMVMIPLNQIPGFQTPVAPIPAPPGSTPPSPVPGKDAAGSGPGNQASPASPNSPSGNGPAGNGPTAGQAPPSKLPNPEDSTPRALDPPYKYSPPPLEYGPQKINSPVRSPSVKTPPAVPASKPPCPCGPPIGQFGQPAGAPYPKGATVERTTYDYSKIPEIDEQGTGVPPAPAPGTSPNSLKPKTIPDYSSIYGNTVA